MVKIGDKVRFLNAVGGGIAKQIKNNVVYVEDEDGFEIPVLKHECVVVESGDEKLKSSQPASETPASPKSVISGSVSFDEDGADEPVIETAEGEVLNVFLAFVPEDIKNLQNSSFETYLVNDSNYFLFFTYLSKTDKGWKARYAGKVEPNMKLRIDRFDREMLNDLERVSVQFIAFKRDKDFALKNAISVEQRIDTVKFYKLHSFRESDFFEENVILYPIVRNDVSEKSVVVSPEELEHAMKQKMKTDKPDRQPIIRKEKNEGPLEVDLHIDELIDSTAGMSNTDILNYQLDKFRDVLNEYSGRKGFKIVFIHGKGDGVLRNAILKELRTKYKSYYCQDASFREYGFGATMVTIK